MNPTVAYVRVSSTYAHRIGLTAAGMLTQRSGAAKDI
jgi:hypothetical protein